LNEINNDIFIKHGVDLELIDEKKYDTDLILKAELPVHIIGSYEKISDNSPTYCFNEPNRHTGVFNGILTGQSEMYSILIDTYSSNKVEKDKLLNAIQHFPCIKKKAEWAKRWINDKETTFASRLVAFAIVEGIFFSSSIYWIKKRGMLHGLTLSNEFISRDEALHVEFAVLLYHKLINKLNKDVFYKIIQEAVTIEKEFILEAIPCRLIGMNSDLMSQYIEFVANRLCLQLGYDKLFPHATNPFDFMELISLNDKVNFFEKTNTQYALANKVVEGDPFDFTSNF
jgi:ribonucleotide reductase beta subunit family protein with ferritin-like domain